MAISRDEILAGGFIVGVSLLLIVTGMNAAQVVAAGDSNPFDRFDQTENGEAVVEQRPNTTVFTAYGQNGGHLVALNPNGTVLYYSNEYDEFYDVDPIGGSEVIVAAMDELSKSECPADTPCSRERLLRINLNTGDSLILYERYRPGLSNNEWHDIDRVGENRYLIAGMDRNQVIEVNTTTGMTTWGWDAQSSYNISSGGSNVFGVPAYPVDWTHLNDVEYLRDGRIMVSMRNHDQVIFLNKTKGLNESWTIGSDDDTDVMYEQHNPDYIPDERGGPAVVIADSQNNRIVEYQRQNGQWVQKWTWSDSAMAWPRDADRLPNNNTLIADTNSHRLLEVAKDGSVVWEVQNVPGVYEVERLETGDESEGGYSASEADLVGTNTGSVALSTENETMGSRLKSSLPPILVNAIVYITPWWWTWTGLDGLFLFTDLTLTGLSMLAYFIDEIIEYMPGRGV